MGDVSVIDVPSSDAWSGTALSKIDSVGCACRRGVEGCADRVFVDTRKVRECDAR